MTTNNARVIAGCFILFCSIPIANSVYACSLFDLTCNLIHGDIGRAIGPSIESPGQPVRANPLGPSGRNQKLVPVREFLRSRDIPPPDFGAYGIMAFRAKPTSVTRERLKMACAAFIAYLARQIEVPKWVPLSDQMVTIWPLDSPDSDAANKDDCDFALDHYELYGADSAIADAEKQGAKFGNNGPFLIGWSPSNTRGIPDKLVLVVDMSAYDSQDSFNHALLFWKEKIVEDPKL